MKLMFHGTTVDIFVKRDHLVQISVLPLPQVFVLHGVHCGKCDTGGLPSLSTNKRGEEAISNSLSAVHFLAKKNCLSHSVSAKQAGQCKLKYPPLRWSLNKCFDCSVTGIATKLYHCYHFLALFLSDCLQLPRNHFQYVWYVSEITYWSCKVPAPKKHGNTGWTWTLLVLFFQNWRNSGTTSVGIEGPLIPCRVEIRRLLTMGREKWKKTWVLRKNYKI